MVGHDHAWGANFLIFMIDHDLAVTIISTSKNNKYDQYYMLYDTADCVFD